MAERTVCVVFTGMRTLCTLLLALAALSLTACPPANSPRSAVDAAP